MIFPEAEAVDASFLLGIFQEYLGDKISAVDSLLDHIERYRAKFPKIKVQVRRSQSSKIPSQLVDGELELALRQVFDYPVQVMRKSGNFWIGTRMTGSLTLKQQNDHGRDLI